LPATVDDVSLAPSMILAHPGRRLATEEAVNSAFVKTNEERAQLLLEVQRIPEQNSIAQFSACRPDQAFTEWLANGHMRYRLHRLDVQDPQNRLPPVRLKQRVMIGAEVSWEWLLRDHAIELPAYCHTVSEPRPARVDPRLLRQRRS
jgi:hypothetical protein